MTYTTYIPKPIKKILVTDNVVFTEAFMVSSKNILKDET